MALIEGFGDEVVWVMAAFVVGVILVIAWFSTGVRPAWNAGNGAVWLVQLQTWPQRRILQVCRQLKQKLTARAHLSDNLICFL